MAFALRQLHRLRCPDAKTAVWAHNMHLNKANHRINGGRSMGTFLYEQLEDDYRAVALIARHAETNWACIDNSKRKPVADPNAIEKVLGDFDEPYLLYDAHRGDLFEPDETFDLGHWDDIAPTEQFDALFFLEHSPPKEPVE